MRPIADNDISWYHIPHWRFISTASFTSNSPWCISAFSRCLYYKHLWEGGKKRRALWLAINPAFFLRYSRNVRVKTGHHLRLEFPRKSWRRKKKAFSGKIGMKRLESVVRASHVSRYPFLPNSTARIPFQEIGLFLKFVFLSFSKVSSISTVVLLIFHKCQESWPQDQPLVPSPVVSNDRHLRMALLITQLWSQK